MATKQKTTKIKSLAVDAGHNAASLWQLVTTVAMGMAAYILLPQDNLTFKVVGAILLANAAILAVVHYTHKA